MPRNIWDVKLEVGGPIKVSNIISLRQKKGFDIEPFYSDIIIKNNRFGITANITAYAPNADIAYKAALYFLGSMVDVLCFKTDLPLFLYYYSTNSNVEEFNTRRILDQELIKECFSMARTYQQSEDQSTKLRAMGWYRKGLMSNDPIEKFLSLWNVIESLGCKYHTETERTQNGAINKIYQCFLDFLGNEAQWGLPDRWINNMHDLRSGLVHGGRTIDIHTIEEVSQKNYLLKQQAQLILEKINKSFEER